jgi:hypothetical protein
MGRGRQCPARRQHQAAKAVWPLQREPIHGRITASGRSWSQPSRSALHTTADSMTMVEEREVDHAGATGRWAYLCMLILTAAAAVLSSPERPSGFFQKAGPLMLSTSVSNAAVAAGALGDGHMPEWPRSTEDHLARNAISSPYDTRALKERADQWRVEAAMAASEATRAFCLHEAERCERRLQQSLFTPVIRGCEACHENRPSAAQ